MLSKFAKIFPVTIIVLIACAFALPLTAWAMNVWLDRFEVRIQIGGIHFIPAIVIFIGALVYDLMKVGKAR